MDQMLPKGTVHFSIFFDVYTKTPLARTYLHREDAAMGSF